MSHRTILICATIALLAACQKETAPPAPEATTDTGRGSARVPAPETMMASSTAALASAAPPSAPTAAPPTANAVYEGRCVVCHGAAGKGDGPGAKLLKPPPKSFADARWQKSVTDERIKNVILKGGAPHKLSPGMPAHPDLADHPATLDELVQKVRAFGTK